MLRGNAVERLVSADEEFAVARDDGRIASLSKRIHGHQFKLRAGLEDEAIAALRDRVAVILREHHG